MHWTGGPPPAPLCHPLQGSEFSTANRNDLGNTFKYLEFCLEQVSLPLCACQPRSHSRPQQYCATLANASCTRHAGAGLGMSDQPLRRSA
jgi:hypothetical protein